MIDWTRLDELAAEIGAEAMEEVVAMFLEEADEVAGRLPSARPDRVEGELHFLKGAALNLGLSDLAQLCAAGERAPRNADLAAVAACYWRSKEAFLVGRKGRTAA